LKISELEDKAEPNLKRYGTTGKTSVHVIEAYNPSNPALRRLLSGESKVQGQSGLPCLKWKKKKKKKRRNI
jgi:hypothetical protein